MSRRLVAIVLAVLLGWTGTTTSEPGLALQENKAASLAESSTDTLGGELQGTVSDHHLDDLETSAHDLPDLHRQGRALHALEERTSGFADGRIGELCSADLPVPQRPPCGHA